MSKFLKQSLSIAIAFCSLYLTGCRTAAPAHSDAKDVVGGPGSDGSDDNPQRTLETTNVKFDGPILTLLRARGWQPGNNCLQGVQYHYSSGVIGRVIEIGKGPCPANGALVPDDGVLKFLAVQLLELGVARLYNYDGNQVGQGYGTASTPGGAITEYTINTLCIDNTAKACSLHINDSGVIDGLTVN